MKNLTSYSPDYWKENEKVDNLAIYSPNYWEKNLHREITEEGFEILNPPEMTKPSVIAKTSYMFRPETRIKAYAKARGLKPSDYRVYKGEIIFQGKDGKTYRETTKGFLPKARKFAIETVTDPVTYLGTAAASAGRRAGMGLIKRGLTEVGAGMAGQAAKQQVAQTAFDEEITPGEKIADIGLTGATGGVLSAGGALATKGGRALSDQIGTTFFGSPSRRIKNLMSQSKITSPQSLKKLKNIQTTAREFGINLNVGEASDNNTIQRWVADLNRTGETGTVFQETDIARSKYIQEKMPLFLKKFFPLWTSAEKRTLLTPRPGFEIRKAAYKKIADLDFQRTKIVHPFYKKAFEATKKIDTSNIIEYIDSLKTDAAKEKMVPLNLIKENFFDDVKLPAKVGLDKTIKWGKTKKVPEMSLKRLDDVKKILDKKIKNSGIADSPEKAIISEMRKIRTFLLDQAESVSPDYKLAREVYTVLTTGKEQLKKLSFDIPSEFTKIGEKRLRTIENLEGLAKISDTDLQAIGGYVLSSKNSSPEIVKQLKSAVLKTENGERVWENAVADYIDYSTANIKIPPTGMQNFGGKLWKQLLGTDKKKQLLQNALNPVQYQNFYTFMDILRRTGLTPTAAKITGAGEIKAGFKSAFLRVWKPLVTPEALASDKIQDWLSEKGMKQLTAILNLPDAAQRLSNIHRIKKIDLLVDDLVSFMSWGAAQQYTQP